MPLEVDDIDVQILHLLDKESFELGRLSELIVKLYFHIKFF